MSTWHTSPYFQDGGLTHSTSTFADGLTSPVSVTKGLQTGLHETGVGRFNVGKEDERQSSLHEFFSGKRKVVLTSSNVDICSLGHY